MSGKRKFWIVHENVEAFIKSILKKNTGTLKELEEYAIKSAVPIMSLETKKIIEILGNIHKPERILEIGTAIGYSSIFFTSFLKKGGRIDTIEIDHDMVCTARENIRKAGLSEVITVIAGDAADVLLNLNKKYDMIFIDAAKGQYEVFFKSCAQMINPGGIIVSDNVLYRGMVAGGAKIHRRTKHMVDRLKSFLLNLVEDERFETSILSIGDGVSISYRKEDNLDD